MNQIFSLFTTYYEEKNLERRAELDECLRRNLESNLFSRIFLLVEGELCLPFSLGDWGNETKLVTRSQPTRQTFQQLFAWVNENADEDTISAVVNSDIFFDDTLLLVETQEMKDVCFALSRWDQGPNGESAHWASIDSQDCWIFKGAIKPLIANFGPGQAGADNRLAAVLNEAGYDVRNPSKTIKAHHLHNSGIRNYDPTDRVMGEYLLLESEYLEIL